MGKTEGVPRFFGGGGSCFLKQKLVTFAFCNALSSVRISDIHSTLRLSRMLDFETHVRSIYEKN